MFAVFGVTRQVARKVAERKTPRTIVIKHKPVVRSDEELLAAIEQASAIQFEKMKPVILSPEYSSPDIATEFLTMAKSIGARSLEVRIKAPVKKVVKGKEKTMRRWLKWDPAKDYETA